MQSLIRNKWNRTQQLTYSFPMSSSIIKIVYNKHIPFPYRPPSLRSSIMSIYLFHVFIHHKFIYNEHSPLTYLSPSILSMDLYIQYSLPENICSTLSVCCIHLCIEGLTCNLPDEYNSIWMITQKYPTHFILAEIFGRGY